MAILTTSDDPTFKLEAGLFCSSSQLSGYFELELIEATAASKKGH